MSVDNLVVGATASGIPVSTVIATNGVTYNGQGNAQVAPTSIVDVTGAPGSRTATDVLIGTVLGSIGETAPGSDTGSSGLNGRLQRIAQRLSSLMAQIPTSLTVLGNLKVAIVEDLVGSLLDSDSISSVTLNTKSMVNGATTLTPKFAKISAAGSGDNTLVAAVTSKKIRVLSYTFICAGTVNVKFQSGAAGTDLTGSKPFVANGGMVCPFNPLGWFESASGVLLNLNLSGAVAVGGELVYVEI